MFDFVLQVYGPQKLRLAAFPRGTLLPTIFRDTAPDIMRPWRRHEHGRTVLKGFTLSVSLSAWIRRAAENNPDLLFVYEEIAPGLVAMEYICQGTRAVMRVIDHVVMWWHWREGRPMACPECHSWFALEDPQPEWRICPVCWNSRCTRCRMLRADHQDGRCLFDATTFKKRPRRAKLTRRRRLP